MSLVEVQAGFRKQRSARSSASSRHPSICTPGSELHRLCRSGDLSAIKSYLNESPVDLVINRVAGLNGCTPLHEAAIAGQEDVVRLLHEECDTLDLNVRTQRGPACTPLHLASERGHIECVMTLIECGASLEAVDRRFRTVKDVAIENGRRQIAHVISLAELEKLTGEGDLGRIKEVLQFIHGHGKLLDIVSKWHQEKLNASLKKACMLGSYKIAILIIRAGANNFEQCIKECTQQNRLNHILAYVRLCQAAYEDDQTAVDILLESHEEKICHHPRYPSLVDFNTILLPLIDNGTLTITEPLHVALKANHMITAGKILLCSSKQHSLGMVDWHGLELTGLETNWLKGYDYSNMQLLCLSFNCLKQIPSQVCNFTSLVKLQVAFNKLTFVPSIIFQMPCIENIDLSYNSIASLPEALIGKVSASLHILTLSSNLLNRFPDYFVESHLSNLDLSKNRFKVVPESICSMKQLESLNMSHNPEIQFIPYELGGLKHLKVTSFDGLPYTFNVPNDSLMDFIRKRFNSMQTVSNYQMAVIGFSQYSHTLHNFYDRLMRKPQLLDCGVLKFDSPTRFLNLHHIFRLPNMLYVLVWDCENRQAPDDLHRVLRHLSIYDPDSPIIVAACWSDFNSQLELEDLIGVSLWRDLRENVQLAHVMMGDDGGGTDKDVPYSFSSLLSSVSRLSERVKVTQFVPGSYYSCGESLANMQEEFYSENKCPMLSEDNFWEVISSMPSHDLCDRGELPHLLSYLRQMGLVLHMQEGTGSQSYCVINRQWFCTVLGNILSRQAAQVIQSVSGIVHQEVLVDLLACTCMQLPIPNTLQYMLNREGVALALSSEKWLIPSMLAETPERTTNISPEQYGIRRQYTFNLTPANFWCRLIAHLLMNMEKLVREVSDVREPDSPGTPGHHHHRYNTLPRQGVIDWSYWKRGILCWQNACHLVYSIESLGACSDPYQETIEIRVPNSVTGYRVMHRLSLIIDTLLKNWYPAVWSSVEIWVPCSYCIHAGVPDVPSISFQDCMLAVSKGVGVKCMQHPDKITSISNIIPDLIQEDVSIDCFLPPGSVEFSVSDKSTCLSPPPAETVFKGRYSELLVAVKPFPHRKMHGVSDDQKLLDPGSPPLLQMWSEFEIFRHLQVTNCPFIIDLIGVCPDPLCLVFPFARWSSLEDVFYTKNITIPHLVRLKMIYQLASALSVLQSYKVIHRNVCLANLLVYSLSVDDTVNIKLAGFSNACYSIFQGISVGKLGTFPAPEMLLTSGGEYDERVDIFAFAFVAYEIITQSRVKVAPLQNHIQANVSRPVLEPVRVRSPYLVMLISKCWQPDRTKRPFASKVVRLLKHPLHVLVRDGQLVNEQHEFFAASARFTRVQNVFHSDLFVTSGTLMGNRTSYLARESLPGLSFESFKQLPSEFVICMGCIGSQLWISFYGKKVRVYSALTMEFINEFTFNYHVVVIAISPTSVYLGLENGVLQVYDVSESVPTEPSLTKIVDAGKEFKCIEALEDSVVCATKNAIFCLHPDTLDTEEKWDLKCKNEIRCIVISRCVQSEDEDGIEGKDLMWVAFRRWEQVLVMNPWTGQSYYTVDCARVLGKPASKVYVQSLRAVLDTVWIGLNTGHILIFASNHIQPRLLTHLKVHREGVRQLLLLHPLYMGPTTILSTTEIVKSLQDPHSSLVADQQKIKFPESVSVVSFGNGLEYPLCAVDKHGGVIDGEASSEANSVGLFAIILEGANVSRMAQIERNSDRHALPYMEDYYYADNEEALYDLPADDIVIYDSPRKLVPSNSPRTDTWSAESRTSPVNYHKISRKSNTGSFSTSISSDTSSEVFSSSPPPLPPRDMPPSPAAVPQESDTGNTDRADKKPNSLRSIFGSLSRKRKACKSSEKSPSSSPSDIVAKTDDGEGNCQDKKSVESSNNQGEGGDHDENDDVYTYPYQDIPFARAQSYTHPNFGSKSSVNVRRLTYDDYSRPDIEDSAEGYDPYVRMDTLLGTEAPNLRVTANKARKKAQATKQKRELSVLSEEGDFMSREDFLGGMEKLEKALDLRKPRKKPPVAIKPAKLCTRPQHIGINSHSMKVLEEEPVSSIQQQRFETTTCSDPASNGSNGSKLEEEETYVTVERINNTRT